MLDSGVDQIAEEADKDFRAETLSQRLARDAADLSLGVMPDSVISYAKLLIADTVGVALAGSATTVAASTRAAIDMMTGGQGPCTVLGTKMRASPRDAALLNGVAMDALGMDDTHMEGACHPSAVLLPATLAVAENLRLSGADVLQAYVAGVEVQTRIGAAARMGFLNKGFGTTPIAGAFGATIAAGILLELDHRGLTNAQGIVGGLAAGSMQFLGSTAWTKNLNKGWPALAGVTAAYLAMAGFEGPSDIYEGRFGTFQNFTPTGHEVDLAMVVSGFGEKWELMNVYGKRYPVCHFLDSTVQASLDIRDRKDFRLDQVRSVVCRVPPGTVSTICEPANELRRPGSAFGSSSSLYYNVALALTHGTVTLRHQESELHNPSLHAIADSISYELLTDTTFPEVFESEVSVTLMSGEVYTSRKVSGPLTADSVESKFVEQTEPILEAKATRDAWDSLSRLEFITDIPALLELLLPAE